MTDVFAHPWQSGFFADDEIAALWSADEQLAHMIAFEAAWSRAGHLADLWSEEEGAKAANAIERVEVDIAILRDGTANDGLCVPALVRFLKDATGSSAIHSGSTSQDVIDTATVLSLVATLGVFERRLADIIDLLARLEAQHGSAALMGRTRMQQALPITVGDRLQAWRYPLEQHLERLPCIRNDVAKVQIGGAVGDRSILGNHAKDVCKSVANALGLAPTDISWHTSRNTLVETASYFSLISGALAKIGQDIALMAQQGIDEIRMSGGGTSSAMPHKQNPILAELLVTLAQFNAVQVSALHTCLVHEQERSGSAWMLEWMTLPQMVLSTGRALNATQQLLKQVTSIGHSDMS